MVFINYCFVMIDKTTMLCNVLPKPLTLNWIYVFTFFKVDPTNKVDGNAKSQWPV